MAILARATSVIGLSANHQTARLKLSEHSILIVKLSITGGYAGYKADERLQPLSGMK